MVEPGWSNILTVFLDTCMKLLNAISFVSYCLSCKCDVIWENLSHVAKGENGKIKEVNIIILMFFIIFIAFEHQ